VLDAVKEAGVLRVGFLTYRAPFSFRDEDDLWTGFDRDLSEELARRLGVLVQDTPLTDTAEGRRKLAANEVRIVIGGLTLAECTQPGMVPGAATFNAGWKVLVLAERYQRLEQLEGRTLAYARGAVGEKRARELLAAAGLPLAKPVRYDDYLTAVQALRQRLVDGVLGEPVRLASAAQGGPDLRLLDRFVALETLALAVADGDARWREALQKLLLAMWKDGAYKKIYERWFGDETRHVIPLVGADNKRY